MAEIELKPCPFCGGEALIFFDPDKDAATIRCDGCSVETQHDKTRLMIETWNRRATRPVSDEAVEECLKTLEAMQRAVLDEDQDDASIYYEIASEGIKKVKALRAALSSHTGKVGDVRDLAQSAVFHYFNCMDGAGDMCGELRPSMARLAKAIGYSDPAVNDEIDSALQTGGKT